ncbi:MAG: chondroitinase-B domain-containing protein, partial [Bacteroidota bacterium]
MKNSILVKTLLSLSWMIILSWPNIIYGEEPSNRIVSTVEELRLAIRSAVPGSHIILKDGEWRDAVIDFNASATSLLPVVIQAQTPGRVVLTGSSMITFSKPYLIVDGITFRNGSINTGSVITFNSDYCQLTNSAIINYNPDDFDTKYYWVYFHGNYNRVDHSFFTGKN